MLAVYAKMANAKYLLDVEPKGLFSRQLVTPATRMTVKMRGPASGLTDSVFLALVGNKNRITIKQKQPKVIYILFL